MQQTKLFSVISIMIYISCGVVLGAMSAAVFPEEENFGMVLVSSFCTGMIAAVIIFIHLVFHETGHLIGGLLTGYHFNAFRIFNIVWQKDSDGKIRVYRFGIAGTAGQCIMEPPEMKDGKLPFFWYNAGGIAMNIVVSVIFLILYLIFKGNPYLDFLYMSFVLMGIALALVNGIPFRGVANDGRNIIEIARSPKALKAFFVQLKVGVMIKKGVRLKDCPDEWFEMPSDEELKNILCCVMAVFSCQRLFDKGQYFQAQTAADILLQKKTALVPVYRQLLKADALFCELTGEKNKRKIEDYLDKDLQNFMKAMRNQPSIIRTQYAYELLWHKNEQAAQQQAELFEKAALKYPYPVEITAERECMALAAAKSAK